MDSSGTCINPEGYEFGLIKSCSGMSCDNWIAVDVWLSPSDPNYTKQMNDFTGFLSGTKLIDSDLNGLPTKKRVNLNGTDFATYAQQFYVSNGKNNFVIYADLSDPQTYQILSTFKFIDSTQDTSQNWETYQSEKIMDSFKTFKLYYPPSWKITVEKRTEQPQTLNVTLSKNSFLIGIGQFPGGVASCLYPEDPQLEGMYARYGEYKEILKKNGFVWRRAIPEGQSSKLIHGVCERRSSANGRIDFVGFTSIGSIYLESPILNDQILSEFDQILEKIEILD